MYHQIIILGNVGKDPELRYLPDGKEVVSFTLASTTKYINQTTKELAERTTWFKVSAWGKTALNANEHLSKGSKVLVIGKLKADKNGNPPLWKRQDDSIGASFEVSADEIRFVSSPKRDQEPFYVVQEPLPLTEDENS